MKGKFITSLCLKAIFLMASSSYLFAAGLRTEFGEVFVKDLEIGESYSIEEITKMPLRVTNTGDQPIQLKIDIVLPTEEELLEGYETLPDISWIGLKQTSFEVAPGKDAVTDVIISIPDEPQYRGKGFQVYLWSHTVGRHIGVGLKSKLLINIKE